jgi:hypothetical protein
MSRFEYLSVLISIVIALGISEVVSTWGRLLRNRTAVRFYWLHAFWSAFAVLMTIQMWWGFWEFRNVESWSFLGLLAVVGECMVLVLCALVLLPGANETHPIDLRRHYFQQCRLFFVLGAVLVTYLAATDWLVAGQPFLHAENAYRVPGILTAALAAAFPSARLHTALAGVATLLLAGFIASSFAT